MKPRKSCAPTHTSYKKRLLLFSASTINNKLLWYNVDRARILILIEGADQLVNILEVNLDHISGNYSLTVTSSIAIILALFKHYSFTSTHKATIS